MPNWQHLASETPRLQSFVVVSWTDRTHIEIMQHSNDLTWIKWKTDSTLDISSYCVPIAHCQFCDIFDWAQSLVIEIPLKPARCQTDHQIWIFATYLIPLEMVTEWRYFVKSGSHSLDMSLSNRNLMSLLSSKGYVCPKKTVFVGSWLSFCFLDPTLNDHSLMGG